VFGADGPILGQMYQTLVRDWHNENLSLRKYSSAIAARNLANDIPDEAVSVLLEVAQRNAPIFQRYFKLKATLLGMDKLRRYDIYAPVGKSQKKYEFGEAAELVFEAFHGFSPQLAEMARRVFDQSHLDSEIRKGKDSGAFCWSLLPELTPYVLLNYQGRPQGCGGDGAWSEARHSFDAGGAAACSHLRLRCPGRNGFDLQEMMLTDKLWSEEGDETVRGELLFKQMDDAYATIMRQSYLRSSSRGHVLVQKHASVDELSAVYMDTLRQQLQMRSTWAMNSSGNGCQSRTFITRRSVYAYAFGQLLVLSLYQQYKVEASVSARWQRSYRQAAQRRRRACWSRLDRYPFAAFWQAGFDVLDKREALSSVAQ
jgi:oligoendopeptidase F